MIFHKFAVGFSSCKLVKMQFLRSVVGMRYLWCLLALHMLNLSIDVADPYPFFVAEDLQVNDQESMVEFFSEEIFGLEDVFPESDDDDGNKVVVKVDGLYLHHFNRSKDIGINPYICLPELFRPYGNVFWEQPIIEDVIPPPEC